MITYEFPEGLQDFSAAEGYTRMVVRGGKLDLSEAPDAALLALIEKYDGKLVEKPKTKTKLPDYKASDTPKQTARKISKEAGK